MFSFLQAIEGLEKGKVQYVLVGGLAALAHGVIRETLDVGCHIEINRENAEETFRQMAMLGLKEKFKMKPAVFSFCHPEDPFYIIDILVEQVKDFERVYFRSIKKPIGNIDVRVCGLEDLNATNEKIGRMMDKARLRNALQIAQATTFEQRFHWLEMIIDVLRPQLMEIYKKQLVAGLSTVS